MHSYELIFWYLGAILFTLARLAYDEWRQHVRYGSKTRDDDAVHQPMTAREADQKKVLWIFFRPNAKQPSGCAAVVSR